MKITGYARFAASQKTPKIFLQCISNVDQCYVSKSWKELEECEIVSWTNKF